MDKEAIWRYYGEVAKEFGEGPVKERDENGNTVTKKDEEGNVVLKRKSYSLQFFYENKLERLASKSPLLSAFLGDENAIDVSQWNCDIPLEDEISQWLSADKKPYKSQIEAIRYAVSRPLTLIQGPPGTGKTEMILNLLSVIHEKYPDKTVAVVSANNEAIKNITDKIKGDKSFSDIREVYAQWGNNRILYDWQEEHKEHKEYEKYKEYFYQKNRDKADPICRFDPKLLTKIPLFSCTIHSLRKIFVNEELFKQDIFEGDELFDYVIVDECSQVSTLLGIVAMSSAKEHLILIGDNEQLTPVVDEKSLEEIEKRYLTEDVPEEYRVTGDNTFLKVCEKVYSGKAQNIMLNEHYRCHPAIIGFCNEYIYDGKLIIKTVDNGRFPIRILWYEGEYSEYIYERKEEDKDKKTLQNMRQIEIFFQEEWTLLLERIKEDMNTSICVISPYRGLLEVLKKRIKYEIEKEDNNKINDLISSDLEIEDEREGAEERFPCLTIHKSQGKGFDIICFLSACDYDKAWPQRRRMMNVAVSRARKEFHMIVCSRWLPENLQEKETGYVLPHAWNVDNYYLIKLIDYAYRNLKDRNLQDGEFGFHRSKITSLFDRVPLYRKNADKNPNEPEIDEQAASAPEKCMREFLVKNFSEKYNVYREVPLGEIYPTDECKDGELKEYIGNGARIDFLICNDKEALLAIEVDGEQHRMGDMEKERLDELKNRCFELLENKIAFLRINTDGNGCWKGTYDKDGIKILSKEREVEKMQDYISKSTESLEHVEFTNENGNAPECAEASAEDLLNYFKEQFLVNECKDRLEKYLIDPDEPGKLKNDIPYLNYKGEEKIDYSNQEMNDLYFCKYGLAYALEYAMLYEIMLWSYGGNKFCVYSFGCGGFIDAWALAYARAKLKEDEVHNNLELDYQGVDKTRWKTTVFGDMIDKIWQEDGDENEAELMDNLCFTCWDIKHNISNFTFRKPQWVEIQKFSSIDCDDDKMCNVLMFPKIISELKSGVLKDFLSQLGEQIKKMRGDFYLCVSNSNSNYLQKETIENIVKIFEEQGFECEDDLFNMLKGKKNKKGEYIYRTILQNKYYIRKEESKKSSYIYYRIGGEGAEEMAINDLDDGFECKEVKDFLNNICEMKEESKCRQMLNANITFQIIRFTKKIINR